MTEPLNRKIVDAAVLAQLLREKRDVGKTVVQCHGCFDIVHPGHVRYLEFARQLGDLLVVSLTGDAAIAKGADRPYIPQELRAENLAALEFVDWVVVDDHPSACELLDALQPSVYVKGREYATANDPRFAREREVVERHGGRVVFHSGDVVFSSSHLIKSLSRDEHLDECRLRTLCSRSNINLAAVQDTLEQFAELRAVVVGDLIREQYVLCDAGETADDAPVLSLQKLGVTSYLGGAAATALQLRALGAQPILFCATGEVDGSNQALRELAEHGVDVRPLPLRNDLVERRTFIADEAKLFRLNDGACHPLDASWEGRAAAQIHESLERADVLVWCDHGYGMVTPGLIQAVTGPARRRGVTIAGHAPDSRGSVSSLADCDLLCTTERRLRNALHDLGSSLPSVAWNLLNRTHGKTTIVSLHKRGLIGFDGRHSPGAANESRVGEAAGEPDRLRSEFVPSLSSLHADLLGVDEAVLSAAVLTLAIGQSLPMATYLAAAAAALSSGRHGCTSVGLDELQAWLSKRAELRPQSRFFPDAATIEDIARLAPPLATEAVR